MTESAAPAPGSDTAPGGWRQYLAPVLVLVAFLMPLLARSLDYLSSGDTFHALGSVLGSWLVLWGLAWLVTRRSSEAGKARGRLIASLLLVVSVFGNLMGDVRTAAQAKDFLRQAQALQERQHQAFVEIGKKFEAQGDVSRVISPEAIARPAANAAALATLDRYRGLIAERGTLLRRNIDESDQFIRTQAPTPAIRDDALKGFQSQIAETTRLFKDLDEAQLALLDVYAQLLRWGGRQGGSVDLRNGQLLFSTREQQAQFKRIIDQAIAAETRHNEVFKTFQAGVARIEERVRSSNAKIDAILGK